MTAYYLSNAGSDAAAGTSQSAPWATIARLNTALAAGQIIGGDSILFRRGDLFYGSPDHSGHLPYPNTQWTTWGAYGTGPKPRISTYKVATQAGWTNVGGNVWRLNLTANSGAYTGATSLATTDVGHLRVNGTVYGAKRDNLAGLTGQWDFYSGDYAQNDVTSFVSVYSTSNPSSGGRTVEIATGNESILNVARHRTVIRDLDLYGGDGGIYGNSYWAPHDVIIRDCDIHDVGGAYTRGAYQYSVPTRAGNGIQIWIGAADWLVQGNRVWNCYDVALTPQGTPGIQVATNQGYHRLHFRGNTVWNNSQSFELGGSTVQGNNIGFVGCTFTDNWCFDAGTGWGYQYRPDPAVAGCHLLFYQYAIPTDCVFERNVLYGAARSHIFTLEGVPSGVAIRNNAVYLAAGTVIQSSVNPGGRRTETIEQSAAYVAATGQEQGTVWFNDQQAARTRLAALARQSGRIVPVIGGLRHVGRDTTWPPVP